MVLRQAQEEGRLKRRSDSPKYRETFAISPAMETWRESHRKKQAPNLNAVFSSRGTAPGLRNNLYRGFYPLLGRSKMWRGSVKPLRSSSQSMCMIHQRAPSL